MSDFPFEIGGIYNRKQIGELLHTQDANLKNGVFSLKGTNNVLLFVTEEHENPRAPGYRDRLFGDVLTWYGQPSGRSDRLIIRSTELKLTLSLFYRKSKLQFPGYGFQYLGPLRYLSHVESHPTIFKLRLNDIVINSEETESQEVFTEGSPQERAVISYERNPEARTEAIRIHGLTCVVCGFNFEDFYGPWGVGYAEVHHVLPLSNTRNERETNPEKDLVVLCSNCHRIIHHFRNHTLTPDELKEIVDRSRGTSPE